MEPAKEETEADEFAKNALIPPPAFQSFSQSRTFFAGDIRRFSKKIAIHPGIVVGRLQTEGLIHRAWHNKLRVRYTWKDVPGAAI